MKSPTLTQSATNEQAFYADIELIKTRNELPSKGISEIKQGMFPLFPRVGSRIHCYINGGNQYFRTSVVVSVQIHNDFVRIQTQNSIYVLKNFNFHEGDKQ